MSSLPADAPQDPRRAAFDAALRARGIVLSDSEAADAFKVAAWMDDGIAALAQTLPAEPAPPGAVDDSAADLSIVEAGQRLRDGTLTSVALVGAHLRRIAEQFDWRLFAPVIVAPIEGGLFAVIDGQHRTHAAA